MSLLDIRYSPEIANIYPVPIFVYNKGTISKSIDIICKLVDQLKLINNIVKNKIIFIKEDLMTI